MDSVAGRCRVDVVEGSARSLSAGECSRERLVNVVADFVEDFLTCDVSETGQPLHDFATAQDALDELSRQIRYRSSEFLELASAPQVSLVHG